MDGAYSRYERWDICTKFYTENVKVRDHLEHLGVDRRITLTGVFKE
jgi:hypothetical protein